MSDRPLWTPSQEGVERSSIYRFMQRVNERHGLALDSYEPLHGWSVDHPAAFWADVWEDVGIIASAAYDQVVDDPSRMPGAKWFDGARLNFAENLLRFRDDQPAIIFQGEQMDEPIVLTYAQLYARVAQLAAALRAEGVTSGDRVVGFMPNVPETIIAMLAATSIGAIWSSCSPDFGIRGVLDRFVRLEPRLLFTANGYYYGGKLHNSLEKVVEIFRELPSHPKVVVVDYPGSRADLTDLPAAIQFDDFIAGHSAGDDIEFAQLPFDHPLYIMYSSGTTGLPKCMVQSAGGILINHLKELRLHVDLRRDDRLFYFTTCGWMMWNWMVSALGIGATIVLFDGSPFHPDAGVLFRLAQRVGITVFGTSAKYIAAIEKVGLKPRAEFDLTQLRTILSTGSPLMDESFEFVYRDIKEDLCLASISGGTDLNGCFAGGNPMGPVYKGELQCRGLGMNVQAFNDDGEPVIGEKGELTCVSAFPSMPTHFWDDPDGSVYHKSYFDRFPGVWHHGDFIEINRRGGVRIFGRSDATLNPGGVRIGTAEIYRQVETLEEIADSLVIGQDWEGDQRIILFVKLADGIELTDELAMKINITIRTNCTPRHLPAKIIAVADIPYTINMKKVEIAVRRVIHGEEVTNRDALANPQALELYRDLPELRE